MRISDWSSDVSSSDLQGERAFLALHPAQHLFDVRGVGRLHRDALPDPARDHAGDGRRGQLAGGRQDPLAGFVMLADDARPAAAVQAAVEVVEQLLTLPFDEALLLLHHTTVIAPARERATTTRHNRPGTAAL